MKNHAYAQAADRIGCDEVITDRRWGLFQNAATRPFRLYHLSEFSRQFWKNVKNFIAFCITTNLLRWSSGRLLELPSVQLVHNAAQELETELPESDRLYVLLRHFLTSKYAGWSHRPTRSES